jgi:FkbM family methyltransferase
MFHNEGFKKSAKSFYKEIVFKDSYRFKQFSPDYFDFVLDIGANVGIFSLFAAMRHIRSRIFAFEPSKQTYEWLYHHVDFASNIKAYRGALGDGSELCLNETGYSGCNTFLEPSTIKQKYGDDKYEKTQSYTLEQIFEHLQLDPKEKFFVKMDCEGGERFLLNDKGSTELLSHADGIGMEVHFRSKQERFDTFPEWKEYHTWVEDTFQDTHSVSYHSSNKNIGTGMYTIVKQEF